MFRPHHHLTLIGMGNWVRVNRTPHLASFNSNWWVPPPPRGPLVAHVLSMYVRSPWAHLQYREGTTGCGVSGNECSLLILSFSFYSLGLTLWWGSCGLFTLHNITIWEWEPTWNLYPESASGGEVFFLQQSSRRLGKIFKRSLLCWDLGVRLGFFLCLDWRTFTETACDKESMHTPIASYC